MCSESFSVSDMKDLCEGSHVVYIAVFILDFGLHKICLFIFCLAANVVYCTECEVWTQAQYGGLCSQTEDHGVLVAFFRSC